MSKPVLSDHEIDRLLSMPKAVTNPRARWKEQKGSNQQTFDVQSDDGEHKFKLFVRQNMRLPDNFSCGLRYLHPSGETVTLTRYNGSDHPHENPLEGGRFDGICHIHRATQRYMEAGRKSEHFAEPTDRYSNVEGALRALIQDCNISGIEPPEPPGGEQQLGLQLE